MKFAANLGSSPLEPMKILQPTLATVNTAPTATTKATEPKSAVLSTIDVPAAQFDWNSAGLTNPLDGNLNVFQTACFIVFSLRGQKE